MIMGIAIVALLAFGGSFAYFTATATSKTSSQISTATLSLTTDGSVVLSGITDNLVPGDVVTGTVTLAGTSTADTIVYIQVTNTANSTLFDVSSINAGWTPCTGATSEDPYYGYSGIYKKSVTAGQTAGTVVLSFTLKAALVSDINQDDSLSENASYQGANFTMTVKAKAIQAKSNGTALTDAAAWEVVSGNFTPDTP